MMELTPHAITEYCKSAEDIAVQLGLTITTIRLFYTMVVKDIISGRIESRKARKELREIEAEEKANVH